LPGWIQGRVLVTMQAVELARRRVESTHYT
jgi:hypothetical protein